MGQIVPSEIARAIAAQRQTVTSACLVCGSEVVGLKTRRYCSNACRQRAFYAKHVDEQRERMRERTRLQRLEATAGQTTGPESEPA
jgi:hypothetical protein